MTKFKEKQIKAKNCDIAVQIVNERAGFPKLFCLHGGPGLSHLSLLPGILVLSELYDLVLVDLRGDGKSSEPTDGNYSLDNYVDDLIAVRQSLFPDEKCGVFGHSFGGFVAIETLGKFPTEFSFAILANTGLDSSWQNSASSATASLPNSKETDDFDSQLKKNPTDSLYKELCLKFSSLYFPELNDQEAKKIMGEWIYKAAPYLYAEKNTFSGMNLSEYCKLIKVPCLIVGASLDKVVPWNCQVKLSNEIKSSNLVRMSDSGHFPFITKPNEFLKTVHNWWTKAKGVL